LSLSSFQMHDSDWLLGTTRSAPPGASSRPHLPQPCDGVSQQQHMHSPQQHGSQHTDRRSDWQHASRPRGTAAARYAPSTLPVNGISAARSPRAAALTNALVSASASMTTATRLRVMRARRGQLLWAYATLEVKGTGAQLAGVPERQLLQNMVRTTGKPRRARGTADLNRLHQVGHRTSSRSLHAADFSALLREEGRGARGQRRGWRRRWRGWWWWRRRGWWWCGCGWHFSCCCPSGGSCCRARARPGECLRLHASVVMVAAS
jgi:hypothetical protein